MDSGSYEVTKRAPLHLQHTPCRPTRSVSSFHAQGYEIAKRDLLQFLEGYKEAADPADRCAVCTHLLPDPKACPITAKDGRD